MDSGARNGKNTPLFVEVTQELGLPARTPYPVGCYFTPESMNSGAALFDFDNDGDLDLYQVVHPPPQKPFKKQLETPAPNRLYQQRQDGTLREVAVEAGVADPGYGYGVAVGDVDSDGDVDLFISNFGLNRLYLNNNDGTFREVTAEAGLDDDASEEWGASAAFVDYDRDGDLDLYVVNYALFDPELVCNAEGGKPDYCGPRRFKGAVDTLYRNNGDSTFTNVTKEARLKKPGRGLGIVCADLTHDGWVDIYVANDQQRNFLWVNQRNGTFRDEALTRGVAVNGGGSVESSMGVTIGDINEDGQLDLFMTHFVDQTNTLYLTDRTAGEGHYNDRSATAGFSRVDLPYTGWGCGFVDIDNDSDLDLALVNGRVARAPKDSRYKNPQLGTFWERYAEPNLLFLNKGAGQFESLGPKGGSFTSHIESTRGMAFGDLDNDGDIDLVTTNVDNMLRVFRNEAPPKDHRWLRIRAMVGSRDALGALLYVHLKPTAGTKPERLMRPLLAAQSYLSSCDMRVHIGLGRTSEVDSIDIVWPDGGRERFALPPRTSNREITLRQGEGTPGS